MGLLGTIPAQAQATEPTSDTRSVRRLSQPAGAAERGANWLVLIAIDKYQEFNRLTAPVRDALEVKRVLLEGYEFDDRHTLELYDEEATRDGIWELFGKLSESVAPQDSVLLYYAGHGQIGKTTGAGFWIPHDGKRGKEYSWLADTQLQGFLATLKAKHALVVADSCFSGKLLQRGVSVQPDEETRQNYYYERAHQFQSRWVLSSGNLEPVADVGLANHSPFAYHLTRALEQNTDWYLDPSDLHYHIKRGVAGQQPLVGPLDNLSGHTEGGAYIFFRKGAEPLGKPPRSSQERLASVTPSRPALPPPVADAESDIKKILRDWETAYETKDIAGLQAVWPGCPYTETDFRIARDGFEIDMESTEIDVGSDEATVHSSVTVLIVGNGQPMTYRAMFKLERDEGDWRIVEHRKVGD